MTDQKRKRAGKRAAGRRGRSRRLFNLNIGTVIFGALFLYLIITIILYATTDHITSCQVLAGTLSQNETYTALVMRTEEIVTAQTSGYVNYFVEDGAKVSSGSTVCSISNDKNLVTDMKPEQQDLDSIRKQASSFSKLFSDKNFLEVYDFKYKLSGMILSQADTGTLSGTLCDAASDGVIAYSSDGYETLREENLTLDDFQNKTYRRENLATEEKIQTGAPLYRLIQSEVWSIVIPVTEAQSVQLSSRQEIEVNFLKDGQSQTGELAVFTAGDQKYVKITFDSGMIRYCSDRFLDVELVTNTKTGLKIPVSSIVSKEFYTIPTDMATEGGENGETGFLIETAGEDGTVSTSFTEAVIYAESSGEDGQDSVYYVDKESFKEGDVLIRPDSNTRYTVGETGSLEGVYCVNKGYAVFRRIVVLEQNEEYCIVEKGTAYGLVQFDYIVENGSSVNEEEILY